MRKDALFNMEGKNMAYSVNKATILGNVGKDPEVRHTQSGKAVANFSVATNEKRAGEEYTEWHNVVVWDKLAELCAQYAPKGTKVYVEGRIQTRKYQDAQGVDKYTTEIVAREIVFLTRAGEESGRATGQGSFSQSRPSAPTDARDEIPF